jgi:hypothetical protein
MSNVNPKKRPFSLSSKRFGPVPLPLPASVARLESILDGKGSSSSSSGGACPAKKKSKNVIDYEKKLKEKEKNHNQQHTINHPFQSRRQQSVNNTKHYDVFGDTSSGLENAPKIFRQATTSSSSKIDNDITKSTLSKKSKKIIRPNSSSKSPIHTLTTAITTKTATTNGMKFDTSTKESIPATPLDKTLAKKGSCVAPSASSTKIESTFSTQVPKLNLTLSKPFNKRALERKSSSSALLSSSTFLESTTIPKFKHNTNKKQGEEGSTTSIASTKNTVKKTNSVVNSNKIPQISLNSNGMLSTETKHNTRRGKTATIANGNFVRLNLKNNAGACRGARDKKNRNKRQQRRRSYQGGHNQQYDDDKNHSEADDDDDNNVATIVGRRSGNSDTSTIANAYVSKMTGLDPLDEFLDGNFHLRTPNSNSGTVSTENSNSAPNCARHQRPCKLIEVKKTNTGNKGRKFFACSMPRGEQCNHFQWADDTVEVSFEHYI